MNTQTSQPVHTLRLFGTPAILHEGRSPITGRAAQHHRLALLALLSAERHGWGRDRLMTLLWPESSQRQARNLLKVSVYVLRRALGEDALVSAGDQLSLNPVRVAVDAREFRDAIEQGAFERAVVLSSEPFLDGFHLAQAPDFEHWLDIERRQLAEARGGALEALAEAAQRRGDSAAATHWWNARSTQDPLDSRIALRLMEALATAGNVAGALRHAATHERLLQAEVGLGLPADVAALATRLRRRANAGVEAGVGATVAELTGEPPGNRDMADVAAARVDVAPAGPLEEAAQDPHHVPPRQGMAGWFSALLTRRRMVWVGSAALTLTTLLVFRQVTSRPAVDPPRIAVLPFRNLTGDASLDGQADLIAEQLVSLLGRVPALLRAISSVSSFQFRERQVDVRRMADSLGASYIIDGSVQRAGDRLQVMLSLVDGMSGIVRWTSTFPESGHAFSGDYERVANVIAEALGVRLPPPQRSAAVVGSTISRVTDRRLAAIELYARSRQQVLFRSTEGRQEVLALLNQAIAADSTFPDAYASLAALLTIFESYEGKSRHDQLADAEQAARAALRIDSTSSLAHYSLGRVFLADYRLDRAREQFHQSLNLDPTRSVVREYLTQLYIFLEQPAEALAEATRGVQDDPLSPNAIAELARALLVNGRCDEAFEVLSRLRRLRPPPARAANIEALCHAQSRAWQRAIDAQRPMADRNPTQAQGWLGFILAQAGDTTEAIRIRNSLVAAGTDEARSFEIALVSAGLGDFDDAFTWLDRAYEERSLRFDVMTPALAELRRDSRFAQLREKLHRP